MIYPFSCFTDSEYITNPKHFSTYYRINVTVHTMSPTTNFLVVSGVFESGEKLNLCIRKHLNWGQFERSPQRIVLAAT